LYIHDKRERKTERTIKYLYEYSLKSFISVNSMAAQMFTVGTD
jgi:hypothetical protein